MIKVIDPSNYPKHPKDPEAKTNGCLTVTFFSRQYKQMPKIRKVGEIIRLHRASISLYKSHKTFTAGLGY
jgi:hypothetical protein